MPRRASILTLSLSTVSLVGVLTLLAGTTVVEFAPVRDAQARVGRPASPGSVAGVARRTTRRTARRHHTYRYHHITVLPAGCTKVVKLNVIYYHCGGVYYQPQYQGSDLVYVVVDAP